MDDKPTGSKMRSRLERQPTDDRHAAVVSTDVDVLFTAEVMVEMDLVPRFG